MPQLRGQSPGTGSHDECAFCIHRGLSLADTTAHDKRNQRVCRGYQKFPRNWGITKQYMFSCYSLVTNHLSL